MDSEFSKKSSKKLEFFLFLIFFLISLSLTILILSFIRIDLPKKTNEHLLKIRFYNDINTQKIATIKKKHKKKKPKIKNGQIVDIAKPKKEKKPQKTNLLSKYNTSVKKQTIAEKFDKNINVRGKKLKRQLSTNTKVRFSDKHFIISKNNLKKSTYNQKKMVKKGKLKGFDGKNGDLRKGAVSAKSGIINGLEQKNRQGSEIVAGFQIPKKFLPYLKGRDFALESPSNDYVKNIKVGNETNLNSEKFLFADYMNRIKKAVSYYWNPTQVLLINDPRSNIYGRKNRFTKLLVSLDKSGKLLKIKLLVSSGVDFLDQEAINSFKKAAPFPNPPKELLEKGRLNISFGFYVNMMN